MPSLVHRTSTFCTSLSAFVPVKNDLAQPNLCSIIRFVSGNERSLRTHHMSTPIVAAALKRDSGSAREGRGSMGLWLLKTEPGEWSWEAQEQNGGISHWDGVRNALAQKHLRSMEQGDHAFFYHSGKGPSVVGVVEVVKTAYPDSTDERGKSCMVDVRAIAAFPKPVLLSVIKKDEGMRDWILLRQSRLSVMPVSPDVWQRVCELGELSPLPSLPFEDNTAITNIQPEEPEGVQPQWKMRSEATKDLAKVSTLPKTGVETTTKTRRSDPTETKTVNKKRARRMPAVSKKSTSLSASVNSETSKPKEPSELFPEAESKTYQRRPTRLEKIAVAEVTISEPTISKTQKPRGVKIIPRDDTT